MPIKTITALIFVIYFFYGCATAQDWWKDRYESRHEITLGYGRYSHDYLQVKKSEYNLFSFRGKGKIKDYTSIGIGLLSYRYRINDRLSVGVGVGYGRYKGETDNFSRWERTDILLAPEASYSYMKRGQLQLYGLAAIGALYRIDWFNDIYYEYSLSMRKIDLTWQVSPVGLRFGNSFGGYVEAGYGYKGLLNLGLSLKF